KCDLGAGEAIGCNAHAAVAASDDNRVVITTGAAFDCADDAAPALQHDFEATAPRLQRDRDLVAALDRITVKQLTSTGIQDDQDVSHESSSGQRQITLPWAFGFARKR